jgi:hypothetical protein
LFVFVSAALGFELSTSLLLGREHSYCLSYYTSPPTDDFVSLFLHIFSIKYFACFPEQLKSPFSFEKKIERQNDYLMNISQANMAELL